MAIPYCLWMSCGPSPRMRGTRKLPRGTFAAHPVHPRVCGEHFIIFSWRFNIYGPSPRMRGTPLVRWWWWWWCAVHPRVCGEHEPMATTTTERKRSIPAYAGNTTARHRCGHRNSGPSPRMRGTRRMVRRMRLPVRSIPAYAGNTVVVAIGSVVVRGPSPRMRGTRPWVDWFSWWSPVHPRVCGEHHLAPVRQGEVAGPSPRMRGTPLGGG